MIKTRPRNRSHLMSSHPDPRMGLLGLFIVFVSLIAVIATAAILYYESEKANITRMEVDSLSAIAELQVDAVVRWRRERLADGAFVAENPLVVDAVLQWIENPAESIAERAILGCLEALRGHKEYECVFLVNPAGGRILAVPGGERMDSDETALLHQFEGVRKDTFIDLHRNPVTNVVHCILVLPILSPRSSDPLPVALLILRIDPHRSLFPLFQLWPESFVSAETLLARREGNEVVTLSELRNTRDRALSFRLPAGEALLPAAMAVRGEEGVKRGVDYRGVPVLAAIRAVPNTPWYMVAQVDVEEIDAPVRERGKTVILSVLLFTMIMGAGAGLLLWRQRAAYYRNQYRAECEKLELARRYELLTKHANDILLLIDQGGEITEANDRAVTTYGYTHEELICLNIAHLRATETIPLLEEHLRQVRESKGIVLETMHRRKDGTSFPVEFSSRCIQLEDRRYYWSIIRDISERKRAEAKLRESEQIYRTIFANTGTATLIIESDMLILFANKEWEKLCGYLTEEVQGKMFLSDFIAGEDLERIERCHYMRCNDPPTTPSSYELKFLHRSGNTKEILATLAEIPGTSKSVASLLDITARKRAEDELRESERRFRELLETVRLIAVMLDTQGNIVFCNDFLLKLTGWQRHEAMGLNWFEHFIPEGIIDHDWSAFNQSVEKGVLPTHHENEIVTRSGEHRTISWNNTLLRDPNGDTIIGSMSIGEDITVRRNLESQVQQKQKMEAIGTLAGGIAHDFNNILAAIMGYTDMAIEEVPEASPTHAKLREVLNSANRAKDLIKQILLFSRQGKSRFSSDRGGVPATSIIKEALKLLRATLPTTIEIRQDIAAASHGLVKADPTQIHQILMNLCTNAGHAMREKGGTLDVSLSDVEAETGTLPFVADLAPGPYVELTVKDTGCGMEPALVERIFEPFFTTKDQGEGTGMGLAVVHGIVKGVGGAITVQSEPGRGSTFHVYLPKAEHETGSASAPDIPIHRGKGRILFVDDEETLVDVGRQMLERLGYGVVAVTSSSEAYEQFCAHPLQFDLLITDHTMPHMTGLDLAKKVMALRSDISVILCTGYNEAITEETALALGIKVLLMKPLAMRDIAQAVWRVLGQT